MTPFIIVIESPLDGFENVFLERLASLGAYMKLTETSFILSTTYNAVDIRETLKDIDESKGMFVSALDTPAAWRNLNVDNEKLKGMYHE